MLNDAFVERGEHYKCQLCIYVNRYGLIGKIHELIWKLRLGYHVFFFFFFFFFGGGS